jgi:hypothetical protein
MLALEEFCHKNTLQKLHIQIMRYIQLRKMFEMGMEIPDLKISGISMLLSLKKLSLHNFVNSLTLNFIKP